MFSRTTPKLLFFTVATDEPLYEDLSVDVDMSGWLLKKRRKRMQGIVVNNSIKGKDILFGSELTLRNLASLAC